MAEWITTMMNTLGYWGIGILMFLENLFPPIPSELIMPLAGFTISQGKMTAGGAIAAGVIGTMLGALPWYYIGHFLGEKRLYKLVDRYGKWLGITGEDISRAKGWFDRHGGKAVFLCRLVPGVRTLISIPAGISATPMLPFLLYSTVGTFLWVSFLTGAGYLLGKNYALVDDYLGPVSKIILALLILAFGFWIGQRWLKNRQKKRRL